MLLLNVTGKTESDIERRKIFCRFDFIQKVKKLRQKKTIAAITYLQVGDTSSNSAQFIHLAAIAQITRYSFTKICLCLRYLHQMIAHRYEYVAIRKIRQFQNDDKR